MPPTATQIATQLYQSQKGSRLIVGQCTNETHFLPKHRNLFRKKLGFPAKLLCFGKNYSVFGVSVSFFSVQNGRNAKIPKPKMKPFVHCSSRSLQSVCLVVVVVNWFNDGGSRNATIVQQRVRLFHSKLFADLLAIAMPRGRARVRTPATKLMDRTCLQTRLITAPRFGFIPL